MHNLKTSEQLASKGITNIRVIYNDNYKKDFDIYNWCIFREGIIKNLFDKGLCKIEYR